MRSNRWLLTGAMVLLPGQVLAQAPPSTAEIETERAALFAQADADDSGTLSLEEFTTFESLVRDKMAERHFNRLDADNDGVVSLEELQADRPGPGPRRHGPPPWMR